MSDDCLTIPLPQLVASSNECLSKHIFTFKSASGGDDSIIIGARNKSLRCVNAAKLSLLLVQTYARYDYDVYCNKDKSSSIVATAGVAAVDPTSLKLENFYVKLAKNTNNGSEVEEVIDDGEEKLASEAETVCLVDAQCTDAQLFGTLVKICGMESGKTQGGSDAEIAAHKQGCSGSTSEGGDGLTEDLFDDTPLDYRVSQYTICGMESGKPQEGSDAETAAHKQGCSGSANEGGDGLTEDLFDDTPLDYRVSQYTDQDAAENISTVEVARTQDSSCGQVSLSKNEHENFDTTKTDSWGDIQRVLYGMEIRSSEGTSASLPKSSSEKKIQHLGRMIYEIFSPSAQQTLPLDFANQLVLRGDDSKSLNELDEQERDSKLKRYNDKSIFSDLSCSGHFPLSICRLLSDMIDIGINGGADAPFSSYEDVMEDLDQIISYPDLYLYDPDDAFFSSNLRFGLRCYGRTNQVKSILKITSSLDYKNKGRAPDSSECVETVFVSGVGGSGKTFLINSIGEYLMSQGWLCTGCKFEVGLEHESRNVIAGVFDRLVCTLVSMRDGGNEEDRECGHRATAAIVESLDRDSLLSLASIVPSIRELVSCDTAFKSHTSSSEKGNSYWRMVFLLSSLMGAILSSGSRILLYFDDLHWCHPTMLSFLTELVISMGSLTHATKRFLFIGMYRSNEVTSSSHPLTDQYKVLQGHQNVNATSINLPSLSENDVTSMLMSETRLPKRAVLGLSQMIHKKTHGHAIYVVHLLNQLVHDSIILYSPMKKRYTWDLDQLKKLPMSDDFASLVVSNLSSLTPEVLQSLQILSCFGRHTHLSIIDHLKSCPDLEGACNILSSLPSLVSAGILERTDSTVTFSHDLIKEQVYNSLALKKRQKIHLRVGTFIGSKASFCALKQDDRTDVSNEDGSEEKREESEVHLLLVLVATDHINNASDLVVDLSQRTLCVEWNLTAATISLRSSNFQSALYYYKNGITFLGNNAWTNDMEKLSYNVYKGAAFASLALGKAEECGNYANTIIRHVSFETSLYAQHMLIMSLQCSGKDDEKAVAVAVSVFRKLGIEMPSAPILFISYMMGGVCGSSPSVVKRIMKRTGELCSQYNVHDLIDQKQRGRDCEMSNKEDHHRDVLNIFDSSIVAGIRLRSPYLPLIVCAAITYSLDNKCTLSALAFGFFGYLHMIFEENYDEGRRYVSLAQKILDQCEDQNPFETHTRFLLLASKTLFSQRSLGDSAEDLFKIYELGMRFGDVRMATVALCTHLRWLRFHGESLHQLNMRYKKYMRQIKNYDPESSLKIIVLEKLLIDFLMGVPSEAFLVCFDGMICDEKALVAGVQSASKNVTILAAALYVQLFFLEVARENYSEAMRWSDLASPHIGPVFHILIMFHTAARGVIAFKLYREGKGEKYFREGKKMLKELQKWLDRSKHIIVGVKVHLLKAELYASECEMKKAKQAYSAAIETAQSHGLLHEQAYSLEMMGQYLASIVATSEANDCFNKACSLYAQYGAMGKVRMIQTNYLKEANLIMSLKHGRES